MTFRSVEVYEILEPLLKDYRKLRYRGMSMSSGHAPMDPPDLPFPDGYSLTYIDEFVDNLLVEERVCDIILPRLTKRDVLEDNGELGPRKSRLLDAMEGKSEQSAGRSRSLSHSPDRKSKSRSRSRGRSRSEEGSHSLSAKSPSPTGSGYRSRTPSLSRNGSKSPYRSRSRSISPDRLNDGSGPRFQSRSRGISPDRMEA